MKFNRKIKTVFNGIYLALKNNCYSKVTSTGSNNQQLISSRILLDEKNAASKPLSLVLGAKHM